MASSEASASASGRRTVPARLRRFGFGLSMRILMLVVAGIMTAELAIFLPSIARFRMVYLQELIETGTLATLALDATPDNMIDENLKRMLLDHARVAGVTVIEPGKPKRTLVPDVPPEALQTFELSETGWVDLIGDAMMAMGRDGSYMLRVGGTSRRMTNSHVYILVDELPMRIAMYAFAGRVLALSLIIAGVTAALIWLALRWLIVQPLQAVARDMTTFRRAPEDEKPAPGLRLVRNDEIGVVGREFDILQRELRTALRQKTRLAELGAAVSKINHDMRNMLATTQLLTDQIARSEDPKVRRAAPMMFASIDRAVRLASETLEWVRERPPARLAPVELADLVEEVGVALLEQGQERDPNASRDWRCNVAAGETVHADRDLLYRVLANLGRNAFEAGAHTVTVSARRQDGLVLIDIADDGPGVPAHLEASLFRPFSGTTRDGGSGLGLAIARDLVRAHGGDIVLAGTGPSGATFSFSLPQGPPRR
jgi:signal transduction histidine kinase